MALLHQNMTEAVSYQNLSSLIQEKTFDVLIEMIQVQNGWKVIDVGCGTGNNTYKLSKMVCYEGKVIGTDPIVQRIEKARETYLNTNLEFYEGFGKDSQSFGEDFDLAVSSTVLNWIPPEEKMSTFKAIYQCLKADGSFIYSIPRDNQANFLRLLREHVRKELTPFDSLHFSTKDELEELAIESGFKHVIIQEKEFCTVLPSLDEHLKWIATSLHNINYEELLKELCEVCAKKNISYMFNEKGEAIHQHAYYYCICSK